MNEAALRSYYDEHVDYDSVPHADISTAMSKFEISPPATVLDLGCGDGRLACLLDASKITGVDYSEKRVERARELHPGHVWVCSTVQDWLRADADSYSLVTMFEVLEHVEDPAALVALARARGPVLASVPINWPDPAHLHVWENEVQMVRDLDPDWYVTVGQRWFCLWAAL